MIEKTTNNTVLKANIEVHSALANSGEYNKSPHFLPENQSKVKNILRNLCKIHFSGLSPRNMLDMGCGTGFIINLAHDLFDSVHGVDITEAMMKQVDLTPGNIELYTSTAENTPFEDESYNMVTAYSFLDHLSSYKPVLKEAYRLLKPKGVFYSDLNPNRHFSILMNELEKSRSEKIPEVITREIRGMLHNGEYYQEKFGIDGATLNQAEPIKSKELGIDPEEFIDLAKSIGFSTAEYFPDWFLGQANVNQDYSRTAAEDVDRYLRFVLPASKGLFKYLRFVLVK